MTDKELKKLTRAELLEMLIQQSKEVDRLTKELEEAKQALEEREIKLNQAGSIAEASLQLNGIFEAAQQAASQYLDSIKILSDKQEKICAQRELESIRKAQNMLRQTKEDCDFMKEETLRQCKEKIKETNQQIQNKWNSLNQVFDEYLKK